MATASNIQWTDATWNPLAGCKEVSPGCTNCYAAVMAHRLEAMGQDKYAGTTRKLPNGKVVWTGKINLDEDALTIPLKRKKPTKYFVNSMSDLFHEDVPDEFIDRCLAVMALCPQHVFQVLTKRAERMAHYCGDDPIARGWAIGKAADAFPGGLPTSNGYFGPTSEWRWPQPNVWLGVSVEDQQRKDRIGVLRTVPAAVRFLSLEPLLDDLGTIDLDGIGWVIVGGESGSGARHCDVGWIRSIVRQCQAAGVPVFVKQLGSVVSWDGSQGGYMDGPSNVWPRDTGNWQDAAMPGRFRKHLMDRKGGTMEEWPFDLRIRQFPDAVVEAP